MDEVKRQAIGVRSALEQSGLAHGPISLHEKTRFLGMAPVPSTAELSRIFRDAGVARVEPRKKPRASFRRIVYPAPNACWQLDGTEYVLTPSQRSVGAQLFSAEPAILAVANSWRRFPRRRQSHLPCSSSSAPPAPPLCSSLISLPRGRLRCAREVQPRQEDLRPYFEIRSRVTFQTNGGTTCTDGVAPVWESSAGSQWQ